MSVFGRSESCSLSERKATCSIRQLKSCWLMSSWSWAAPIGIDLAASAVQGPAGSGAWRGVEKLDTT